jgi:hypothetical protein
LLYGTLLDIFIGHTVVALCINVERDKLTVVDVLTAGTGCGSINHKMP